MGLKKKSKVSAEFSMSSLTDIIFLLLIFFMLTSSMVVPNALNLRLPGKSTSTERPPSKDKPVSVTIDSKGKFYLNGNAINTSSLENQLRAIRKKRGKDAAMTIKPNANSPTEYVVRVMDMAYRLDIQAIMTDPS